MVPLWSFGRDSDPALRSGHSLADPVSPFLCSDLCNLGGLTWVNRETILSKGASVSRYLGEESVLFQRLEYSCLLPGGLAPYQGVW